MRLSKRARDLVKDCDKLLEFADKDGIVCIPGLGRTAGASERLVRLLDVCGIGVERDPDDWLRDSFFEEHCKLFHDRPFVWHIWDGRKRDGFHALVNYHKLCGGSGILPLSPESAAGSRGHSGRRLLENLTYSYLGEWITRQKDSVKGGEDGAEGRLAAAIELQNRLKLILEGEPPFDIFVRWKPLGRATHRLGAGHQRRPADEHPAVPGIRPARRQERRRHSALQTEHQVGQRPRKGAGAPQGRVPLVLGLG